MKIRHQFTLLSTILLLFMLLSLTFVGFQLVNLVNIKNLETKVSRTFLHTREYLMAVNGLTTTAGSSRNHIDRIQSMYGEVEDNIAELESEVSAVLKSPDSDREMKNLQSLWKLVKIDSREILRRTEQIAGHMPDYEEASQRNSLQQISAYAGRRMPEICATYFDGIFSSVADVQFADQSFRSVYEKFNLAIEESVNRQVRRTLIVLSAALLFMVIAVMTLLFIFGSIFTKRISRITRGIFHISQKKLTHELQMNGNDELTSLAGNSNKVISFLKENILSMISLTDFLMEISSDLSESTDKTKETSGDIEKQIENIHGQMMDLKGNLHDVHLSLKSSNEKISSQNGNIELEAQSVALTTGSVDEINNSIKYISDLAAAQKGEMAQLMDMSEEGCRQMTETVGIINKVRESLGEIEQAASIIRGIAAQTSLLSMNAAIEAAHAGEAGAGFSVVADEIRKLSDSSNSNTRIITGVIDELAERINSVSMLGEKTNSSFLAINNKVRTYSSMLNDTVTSTEQVLQGSLEIRESMHKISEAIEFIKSNSSSIRDDSDNVENSISAVESNLARTLESLDRIKNGISGIVEDVDVLDRIGRSSSERTNLLHATLAAFEV